MQPDFDNDVLAILERTMGAAVDLSRYQVGLALNPQTGEVNVAVVRHDCCTECKRDPMSQQELKDFIRAYGWRPQLTPDHYGKLGCAYICTNLEGWKEQAKLAFENAITVSRDADQVRCFREKIRQIEDAERAEQLRPPEIPLDRKWFPDVAELNEAIESVKKRLEDVQEGRVKGARMMYAFEEQQIKRQY